MVRFHAATARSPGATPFSPYCRYRWRPSMASCTSVEAGFAEGFNRPYRPVLQRLSFICLRICLESTVERTKVPASDLECWRQFKNCP